jgi:hypothetical protein
VDGINYSITIDGVDYGAQENSEGPVGGGPHYYPLRKTSGDIVITSPETQNLIDAIAAATSGQTIFIQGDIEIDFTGRVYSGTWIQEITTDITIASDRGHYNSPGAKIVSEAFETIPLFEINASNVRFTGLRFEGPSARRRFWPQAEYVSVPASRCISLESGNNLRIDNCEFSNWGHAAIRLVAGSGHRIHHCHFHDNAQAGLGYGVVLNGGEATIDHCYFERNRHSVAATGNFQTGYIAEHNVFKDDYAYSLDVHPPEFKNFQARYNTLMTELRGIDIEASDIQVSSVVEHNWFPNSRETIGSGTNTVAIRNEYSGTVFANNLFDYPLPGDGEMATVSKSAGQVILAHQAAVHPTTIVGSAQDVGSKLSATLFLFHGFVEAAANTNAGSWYVQASASPTGNEDWITIATYTSNIGTPADENLTATEPAGETVLAVASTTGFAARDLLYIQDTGTLADSEWGFCSKIVTNTSIDLVSGLARQKDSSDKVFNLASRFILQLDLSSITRIRVFWQHQGATGADGHIKALMVTGDSIG